jgi:hypothetical protein
MGGILFLFVASDIKLGEKRITPSVAGVSGYVLDRPRRALDGFIRAQRLHGTALTWLNDGYVKRQG